MIDSKKIARVKATALRLRYANKCIIYLNHNFRKQDHLQDCTVRLYAFVGQHFSRQFVNVEIT